MIAAPPRTRDNRARSRSPPRHHVQNTSDVVAPARAAGSETCSTGHAQADKWLEEHELDPDTLERFASIPRTRRLIIAKRCINDPPRNLDAYLRSCAQHWSEILVERRTTAGHRDRVHGPAGHHNPTASEGALSSDVRLRTRSAGSAESVAQSSSAQSVLKPSTTVSTRSSNAEKAAFLCYVTEDMTTDAFNVFQGLTEIDRISMAVTAMRASPENPYLRLHLLTSWLPRSGFVKCVSPSQVAIDSSVPTRQSPTTRCHVQFIVAGWSTDLCSVVLMNVRDHLQEFSRSVHWFFKPVIVLHPDMGTKTCVDDASGRLRLEVRPRLHSLADVMSEMESLWTEWSADGVRFVLVSCLSPRPSLRDHMPVAAPALRHQENLWLWEMVCLSNALRSRVGHSAVADALIAPWTVSTDFAQEATWLWGPRSAAFDRVDVERERGAEPAVPAVFSTPCGFDFLQIYPGQKPTARTEGSSTAFRSDTLSDVLYAIVRKAAKTWTNEGTDEPSV